MFPKYFLLTLITLIISTPLFSNNCCNRPLLKPVTINCPAVNCNSNVVHIAQSDVTINGYVISTSGRYCLIEDITFAPVTNSLTRTTTPTAAITILASNVQLDLNGYTLSGSDSSGVVGVKVASPGSQLTNVHIINGSIQQFTLGIYVDPVNTLLLENLEVINNGQAGYIENNGLTFVGGIGVTNGSSNVVINRVNASNNLGTSTATTYGAAFNAVNFLVIQNSQFNNNSATNSGAAGLYIALSTDVVVDQCQANNNSGSNYAVGFYLSGLNGRAHPQFTRCHASDNFLNGTPQSLVGQNTLFADGFYLVSIDQGTFIDCSASQQTSSLAAQNLPQSANGFELEGCFDCHFEQCSTGNNGFSTSINVARGFHVAANRCTFQNCFSQTNFGLFYSYGFDLENFVNFGSAPTNSVIPSQDVIINSKIYGEPLSANTDGIRLHNAVGCVVEGCILQSNAPDGILLDQDTDCYNQNNIIKHNQIINLSTQEVIERPDAQRGFWAIEDLTCSGAGPTNYYADNYAYDYPGATGVGYSNYNVGVRLAGDNFGDPGNGFIAEWMIPGDPPSNSIVIPNITNFDIEYSACGSGLPVC